MSILPLVVIIASVVAFFLDEFTHLFKKIFEKRWMQIVTPLLISSILVMIYYEELLSILLTLQSYYRYAMLFVFQTLPYKWMAGFFAQFLIIFFTASTPASIVFALLNYRKSAHTKTWTTYVYFFMWVISILLWAA